MEIRATVGVAAICVALAGAQTASPAKEPTFAVSIRLRENPVKPGGAVIVDIDLKNTSRQQIQFFLPTLAPLLYKLKVTAVDEQPIPLTPIGTAVVNRTFTYKGKDGEIHILGCGSVLSSSIAPGEVLHDAIVLSDFFDFGQPKQYTIRLQRANPYTSLVVDSNTATLTAAARIARQE